MEKNLVKKLHPQEKKIILALSKINSGNAKTIAKQAHIPEDSIHKAAHWAEIKGLVKSNKKIDNEIKLTDEGKKYLKEGLPEKNLLKKVIEKSIPIFELKGFPDFNIALAWAKKRNWVSIQQGKLSATPDGIKSLNKKTKLEDTMKTCIGTEKEIKELEKRNLIKVKEIKIITYELTMKGKSIVPKISKIGEELGQLTVHDIKSGKWKKKKIRPYDVTTPVPTTYPAKLHPYTVFLNDMKKKLVTLGFQEMKGPFVELAFWNFDALFMPQDHPARGIHDIYELKNPTTGSIKNKRAMKRVEMTHKNGWITGSKGWGKWDQKNAIDIVLRSHTTPTSVKRLAAGIKPPEKFFTIDRVFRPDVIDAKHLTEFSQCDGIVIAKKLTFKHLLGYLKKFASMVGIEKVRFKPGYFPFTEPSVEMFGKHPKLGWIEFGGAGMFRPEVTKPLGVDCPVLAWGLGIDRLAMIKLGLDDIRMLFSSDLDFLRESKIL